jgi:hypothetical protein
MVFNNLFPTVLVVKMIRLYEKIPAVSLLSKRLKVVKVFICVKCNKIAGYVNKYPGT